MCAICGPNEDKPRTLARTALVASLSRPPYGSHSRSSACQKRPTSQCGWARRAAAQTAVAQRVQGDAGKALLRNRGNESLRRRLSEGAPTRGAQAGDGFIVGGSSSRAKTWLANELSVVKSGGKEVSHIEKNSDIELFYHIRRRRRETAGATPRQHPPGPPQRLPLRPPRGRAVRQSSEIERRERETQHTLTADWAREYVHSDSLYTARSPLRGSCARERRVNARLHARRAAPGRAHGP